MPVIPNHLVTHQWMRELRKWGSGALIGVYFRVPDDESVWVGHYNAPHRAMTAAAALAFLLDNDPQQSLGYEIIIPHTIAASAIHRIKVLSKPVGWRHFPTAHGKVPCGCPICSRGEFKSRARRDAYEAQFS